MAKIVISSESDDNTGIPVINDTQIEIMGRYEPAGQKKTLDYSARFYCKSNDIGQFKVDGQKLFYQNKQFKIVQLHNYQSHCEIWLE